MWLKRLGTAALLLAAFAVAWLGFQQERAHRDREHEWKMWVIQTMADQRDAIDFQHKRIDAICGRLECAEHEVILLRQRECSGGHRLAVERQR